MRRMVKLLMAVVLGAGLPAPASTACEPGTPGCMPTAAECASGGHNGVTDGGQPGRAAVCVGHDGRTVAYAGGNALTPCGEIMVADVSVTGSADPNDCPRDGAGLPGSTWQEEWFESPDGTDLHADVFRPEGMNAAERTPVILMVTPYANNGGTGEYYGGTALDATPTRTGGSSAVHFGMAPFWPHIFERGYTFVVVALPGFGGSGGCSDFGGPGDQAAVTASVEWAASRAWSTGKVGMIGFSAGGWTQMMALANDPEGLAAVVVGGPPIDRYAQSYTNGIPHWFTALGSAGRYEQIGAQPPSLLSSPGYVERWGAGSAESVRSCSHRNLAGSAGDDPADAFWAARDLTARAASSDVPVLLNQGFLDSNVKPGRFLHVWEGLRGPRRAWFGQWEHTPAESYDNPYSGPGPLGRGGFRDEALAWFDTYLKGVPSGVDELPPVVVERSDGTWRAEEAWPPTDVQSLEMRLLAGRYADVGGNAAEAFDTRRSDCLTLGMNPCTRPLNGQGSWTFTAPFEADAHLAGPPVVEVSARTGVPGATLIALMYDVDPSGRATLLTRGAFKLRQAGEQTARFELYPQDWVVRSGHRIGVLLTGSDTGWFAPVHTGSEVEVLGGSVALPALASVHEANLTGEPSQAGRQRSAFHVDPGTIASREN